MMGAGKSTIGRRLSARLGLPFLDADAEIEAAAGMSIPDIFETRGEPDFRDQPITVDLKDVGFEQALNAIASVGHTFHRVLDSRTVMVVPGCQ